MISSKKILRILAVAGVTLAGTAGVHGSTTKIDFPSAATVPTTNFPSAETINSMAKALVPGTIASIAGTEYYVTGTNITDGTAYKKVDSKTTALQSVYEHAGWLSSSVITLKRIPTALKFTLELLDSILAGTPVKDSNGYSYDWKVTGDVDALRTFLKAYPDQVNFTSNAIDSATETFFLHYFYNNSYYLGWTNISISTNLNNPIMGGGVDPAAMEEATSRVRFDAERQALDTKAAADVLLAAEQAKANAAKEAEEKARIQAEEQTRLATERSIAEAAALQAAERAKADAQAKDAQAKADALAAEQAKLGEEKAKAEAAEAARKLEAQTAELEKLRAADAERQKAQAEAERLAAEEAARLAAAEQERLAREGSVEALKAKWDEAEADVTKAELATTDESLSIVKRGKAVAQAGAAKQSAAVAKEAYELKLRESKRV